LLILDKQRNARKGRRKKSSGKPERFTGYVPLIGKSETRVVRRGEPPRFLESGAR